MKITYYIDKLEEAMKHDENVRNFCEKYMNEGSSECIDNLCVWDLDVDEEDEFMASYINEYC